jgi:hypothetical protein
MHNADPNNQMLPTDPPMGVGDVLVSCSLAPGYDRRDSFNPTVDQLAALKQVFPAQVDLLQKLAPT